MRKILFLLTILVFLIVSCNKRDSIEEHLGSIYYDINDETKETNYLYLDKSGTIIYEDILNITDFNVLYYKYDSNNIYVFENGELAYYGGEPTAFFLNKDGLTIIESFYEVKPIKTYELLDKNLDENREYYSIANEYDKQRNISYNKSNFINGKEPYEKREYESSEYENTKIETKSLLPDFRTMNDKEIQNIIFQIEQMQSKNTYEVTAYGYFLMAFDDVIRKYGANSQRVKNYINRVKNYNSYTDWYNDLINFNSEYEDGPESDIY
ncbi:hypothetical protein [Brachyspira sp. SAP_772]|uniref:hypothetical protein n=1 Tax=Brachyspira sp. SAP_772 TaxID=2608385 RepID=UPI0012F495D3|nr:hypothetical protein [Brachyspira sp. SAP_772]